MIKLYFILLLVLFPGFVSIAQTQFVKNNAFLELGGNGGVYSLNYERSFTAQITGRIGVAAFSGINWSSSFETSIITVPVLINFLHFPGKHKLETGAGVMFGRKTDTSSGSIIVTEITPLLNLTAVLGYRYQKPDGGFLFRAGLTPFYALRGGDLAFPQESFTLSGGVSFGYGF